jgi:hypothetical protein
MSREAGPLQDATEELLERVLPVVLARMQRASTRLATVAAKLKRESDGLVSAAKAGARLEEVQEESEALGWILGVLACAAGDDLLLARREPYGVALVADVVAEVLAAEGRALEPDASRFPDVAPRLEDGWRLPWTVGLLLRLAARTLPEGAPIRWRFERGPIHSTLTFLGVHPAGAAPLLCDLEALLPGAEARVEQAGFGMGFPAEWFAPTVGGAAR